MLNSKDEIRISQAIIHIMDPGLGMPVLSDAVLDLGSDLADFLKAHIYRIDTSDDVKNCSFLRDTTPPAHPLLGCAGGVFVVSC